MEAFDPMRRWFYTFLLVLAALASVEAAPPERIIVDMVGRNVSVPAHVQRVATLGAVPVINSFIFTLGEGQKIANGLPPSFARSGRYRLQSRFAPDLAQRPLIQSQGLAPDLESLMVVAPDVVLTMDPGVLPVLARCRIPVVCLAWRNAEDVPRLFRLLGELFQRSKEAEAYLNYFEEVQRKVGMRLQGVAKPKVLFASINQLSQSHLIADWWIQAAGGISVTANGRRTESMSFSIEQLLAWDPDVIIVSGRTDEAELRRNPKFSRLKAVLGNRIFVSPMGAHLWANRTSEQPLMVLWAARAIHPEIFRDLNLEQEVANFYTRFYRVTLSAEEVRSILNARP